MKIKHLLILFGCFSILTGMIVSMFIIGEKDHQKYYALINRKKSSASSHDLEKQQTEQLREQVRKDIWLTQENGSRHHIQIKSKGSSLSFSQKKQKYHLVEKLYGIECWMQDKVHPTKGQQLRYFTAAEGTYSYPSHCFLAKEININFLSSKGKELPETFEENSAFLKGTANKVIFQLGKKSPLFHAYHFSAQLDTDQGDLK